VRVNRKDLAAGLVFVAIGLAFGLNAWFTLRIGAARSMGPGYFPVLLGATLVGLGLAIGASALKRPAEPFGAVPWRGLVLVILSIVFFAATVRGLGMAPSLGLATVVAALSSGRLSVWAALALSAVLTTLCILIFLYALQLPYPVIGPWLAARLWG
jgi:hypothetical protein